MLGFLSKEKASERKLAKASKKLLNMFVQSPDRRFAAQTLLELDTPAAYAVLFERFEKKTNNHTLDREEKVEIVDMLVDRGQPVIAPLIAHVKGSARSVNWPLRILGRLQSEEQITSLLVELLSGMDTDYERDPEKKEELVLAAQEHHDERLGRELVRFLDDANERIRFLAADALFAGAYDFAAEPLVRRLTGIEESIRVVTRIVDGFTQCDWTVEGHRAAVEEHLPDGFAVTRAGTIRRRGAPE
jgi:hypothetical protein